VRPQLRHVGQVRSPVVVIDDFTGAADDIVDLAAALAPFPTETGTYYPGLRRRILPGELAYAYVERLLEVAAPFVGGGFDVDRFDLIEASFSMVTTMPAALDPMQRSPHFDSTNPDHLAILHYLSDTPGTAFFRQRATGIELVDASNVSHFVAAARQASQELTGYIHGSNPHYEQIGLIEGVRDRLAIYRGAMLHSGVISPDMTFSPDPRAGRLTANIFIKVWSD